MDLDIIGGQDGPTAILILGVPAGLVLALLLAAALIGGAVWLVLRKRNK